MKPVRIALTGYARTGKDSIAYVLKSLFGLEPVSIGNLAKRELDNLCIRYFGFSAFTENDEQKTKIRKILIEWIEAHEERLIHELGSSLGPHQRVINPRIVSPKQMRAWKEIGGVVVCIKRPEIGPANAHENLNLATCTHLGLIDSVYVNGVDGLRPRNIAEHFARYIE